MKRTDKTKLRVFLMLLAYVFLLCLLIFFIKFRSRNKKIIFGSTYMTMNNPYFNVLKENLRDTIEANGDILITRDPAQSQSRQNAQIIDMLNEGIDILFVNAVDRSGIESALYECKKRGVPVILLDTDVDDRVGVEKKAGGSKNSYCSKPYCFIYGSKEAGIYRHYKKQTGV